MNKKGIHKDDKGISPMTPCRPVGLRRKHSGVKNTNTPSFDLLKKSDITSPVSVNAGSIKARVLAGQISLAKNVQDLSPESHETKELENLGNNDNNIVGNKRKSTTPLGRRIVRKIVCSDSASPASANINRSKNQMLYCKEDKSSLVKSHIPGSMVSRDSNNAKGDETDTSQSHCPTPLTINVEESLEKRFITTAEINTFREQIAAKEKKLKELELAALYKKKHNHEQVAKEIECWLRGCKQAIYDLQSELAKRNQSYSVNELLKNFGIPPSLLEIDEDSE